MATETASTNGQSSSYASLLRFIDDYGMLFVLLVLALILTFTTIKEQNPKGKAAAQQVAKAIEENFARGTRVLIAARDTAEDREFAESLNATLADQQMNVVDVVIGSFQDARRQMQAIVDRGETVDLIAGNGTTVKWPPIAERERLVPALASAKVVWPRKYLWSTFLTSENLSNISSQIAVIAIIAIGMTMVIITAGIDLSVGSLIALSSIVALWCMREFGGGKDASTLSMILCSLGGIAVCTLVGLLTGILTTRFRIPSFIVTLAMMLIASGAAFVIAENQSIYQVPASYGWLGIKADLLGIPNSVVLMVVLYVIAHIVMTRTTLGRYIYAVGGNQEASLLSGVPVNQVILFVFAMSGALAGLGGIVMASQLTSANPTFGIGYELQVIAAVVVGGTSLFGGEGKMFGTLIGAFIIAVINNGMNLIGLEGNTQRMVLGIVILLAVLLEEQKKRWWNR